MPPLSLLGLFAALVIIPELAQQGSPWLVALFLWLAPGPVLAAIAAYDMASAQAHWQAQAAEGKGPGPPTWSVRAANSQIPTEADE
jgi:hypothetical protein